MKTDEELQKAVQNTIKLIPLLNATKISVTANDGVITLAGIVDSYAKKFVAEDAAKNVAGVKTVVRKIEIQYGNNGKKNDNDTDGIKGASNNIKIKSETPEDIEKREIADALIHYWTIFNRNTLVNISYSGVMLNGKVQSLYQNNEIERIEWGMNRAFSKVIMN